MFCHVFTQTKLFKNGAIVVYLGESIMMSWNLFLDSETCGTCCPWLRALKAKVLTLTPLDVYTQQHVYRAHVNIYQNVGKSKLKLQHTRAIATAINAIIDKGGDLMYHWVHQRDEDGNDIFSPSNICLTFPQHQWECSTLMGTYGINTNSSSGSVMLVSFLHSFPVETAETALELPGITNQPAEPWTQDKQSAEYQTAVRCMSKYLFHYWLVYRIVQC